MDLKKERLRGEGWTRTVARERSRKFRKWFELIAEQKEDLAITITLENGKRLKESRVEVDYAAAFVEWFAEEANRAHGRTIPSSARDVRFITIKQSVSLVGLITP